MAVSGGAPSNAQNAKVVGCNGGTTLVLSHGYGADQSIWDDVVPDLAERFQVVLFDWNFSAVVVDGCGGSGGSSPSTHAAAAAAEYSRSFYEAFAEALVSLLEKMNLSGVVFVGHSMAGMVGCVAAVRRPDLFRRLVLLGASPRYLNAEGYEGGFSPPELEAIFSDIESGFTSWAGGFARAVVGESRPDAAERFARSVRRMRPEVALAVAKAVFLSDLREVLGRVRVPCAVISGANDPVVPVAVARYVHGEVVGGEAAAPEILDFEGHFPQLVAGRLLVDALRRSIGLG